MQSDRTYSRRLLIAFLAMLGLALGSLVVMRSLVASLADASPQSALAIRPTDSATLLKHAGGHLARRAEARRHEASATTDAQPESENERSLRDFGAGIRNAIQADQRYAQPDRSADASAVGFASDESGPSDDASTGQIRAWIEMALASDPLNARGLRMLGQLEEESSDSERARRLMGSAARLSHHETLAVAFLLEQSLKTKDYPAVMRHADTLLRTKAQAPQLVVPILARLAEDREAAAEIKRLVATNPPWRAQFFAILIQNITDARIPLDLFLGLEATDHPATSAELLGYLDILISHKLYELAYYAWLQFLPPEQLASAGHLFNRSFETIPTGQPFDWLITPGSGVTVEIAKHPDEADQHVLSTTFGHGRVEFRPVTQIVLLAPGGYQMTGKYKGLVTGRRGLVWRVGCANTGHAIAESPMILGVARTWTEFKMSFSVPDRDCRAQAVRLELDARSASEQFVSGAIMFDDMRIVRKVSQPSTGADTELTR